MLVTHPCPIATTPTARTTLVYSVASMSCLAVLHGSAACWQPPQSTQPLPLRDSHSHAVTAATFPHSRRYEDDDDNDDETTSKFKLSPLLLAYYNGFSLDRSTTVDHSIHIYDASTRRTVASLRGHSHAVEWLTWSPCGTRMLSGTAEHAVLLWHVERQCAEYLLRGRSFALLLANPINKFFPTSFQQHSINAPCHPAFRSLSGLVRHLPHDRGGLRRDDRRDGKFRARTRDIIAERGARVSHQGTE